MKRLLAVVLVCGLSLTAATAQLSKQQEKLLRRNGMDKVLSQRDRAGGTHNKSNIGLFFENRGKLYPSTIAQGVSGEWPLNSGHEYIYRANPVVARPRNAIAGRFRTSEEWEARAGFVRPDSARIAFSDKPNTWPAGGWPVKDAAGNPVIVSDQDSYCVYNDSTNRRQILGIEVHQIGYAFGLKLVRDMLYFTYKVINVSQQSIDSVYFGLYMDLDIGDVPSGEQEYADDRIGFNKDLQLVYYYDDGVSTEWPGANTGYFGLTMISTPLVGGTRRGITDLHYNLYDDDTPLEQDTVHYGVLSSAPSLYASTQGPKYFHPGKNLPDLHFDDMETIPATGLDLVTNIASGPYTLHPGDTLTFVTAFVAGNSLAEITANTQKSRALAQAGFLSPRGPVPPQVRVEPGSGRVRVTWDNRSESDRDFLTGRLDFEGYRLYKSTDRGVHWDQINRNQFPETGADPVPIATYDKQNGIPPDKGLQYSFVDSSVINGFEYWYTVTAYDQGDTSLPSLESPRGTSAESVNLGVAIPRSAPLGVIPATPTPATQSGTGQAVVTFLVQPIASADAGGKTYETGFNPWAQFERGNARTKIQATVDNVQPNSAREFGLAFLSPTRYRIRDLLTGALVDTGSYTSGTPILFAGIRLLLTDTSSVPSDRPEADDSLVVRPGIVTSVSGTEVLPLRPFTYGTSYATTNGLVFSIQRTDTVTAHAINYNDRFRFSTEPQRVDPAAVAAGLERVRVVPNPYLVSSTYEEEFGTRGTRREPIRQLKFNNLPPQCSISIFTLDGDRVITLDHQNGTGTETWDMRASSGREIAAGVYVYIVKTDNAEKIDRFAVIK